jgi:hypothetical protein
MPNQGSKNPRVYSGSIKIFSEFEKWALTLPVPAFNLPALINPSDSDMVAVRINLESAKEQPGNAQ